MAVFKRKPPGPAASGVQTLHPAGLAAAAWVSGDRAFLSLLRNAETWETATKDYGRIEVPVLLVWGDRDWARPSEREHDRTLIPGVQMTTLERAGHFLPLDRPAELSQSIVRFAAEKPAKVISR